MTHNELAIDLVEWMEKCPVEKVFKMAGVKIMPLIGKSIVDFDVYEVVSKMKETEISKLLKKSFELENKFTKKYKEMKNLFFSKFAEKQS